jgi:hypothetical protein
MMDDVVSSQRTIRVAVCRRADESARNDVCETFSPKLPAGNPFRIDD